MINRSQSHWMTTGLRNVVRAVVGGVLVVGAALAIEAAPLEVDLGQGLLYFRAHQLPADLPPAAVKAGPLVLDLRFTSAADSAHTTLDAWLKFRSTPTTPVFVLINGTTPEAIQHVLLIHQHTSGFLTVGTASSGLTPDIVTKISTEEDRTAYDALENGAPLESLITENAGKRRTDEAAILEARTNPPVEEPDPTLNEFDAPIEKAAPNVHPAKPVIDVSLQRVIQIHRGLLALKKLPTP